MRSEQVRSDVVVVGGGLAGVCAAIGAARQGATVSLVQNRPVLGGNSSSEIRVWVCGATAHGVQPYARETGVMGELFVENQFTNPEGNPYYWDLTVLEAVRAEPNISLYLNTDVREVAATGPEEERTITSVTGWMMGSEREITFTAPTFLDCTGDGLVGFLAGAHYRTGREPRSAYGESWAPEVPDDNTLGSTLLFYSKDIGRPVKFVPPSFALDISTTSIPERRAIKVENNGCAYWWIEWGGELDVVHDDAKIRDELQAAVYGIWDWIKNSGRFDAETLTLEWVGSVPGKREYRRFLGDHVLTQHDVLGLTDFEDKVAFGGWSIDLHPPGGMYATESGSKHWHPDGVYSLPLRCLYSRNVTNMWMAGRNISASHVAFGSTRVMATCAVLGEAAGVAAALATRRGVTPRQLARDHLAEVHHALVRADASVVGLANEDPADLARRGTAVASSTLRQLVVDVPTATMPLQSPLGLLVPVDPRLGRLELLLDAAADTELRVRLHRTERPQVYLPGEQLRSVAVPVAAGQKQWVEVDLDWEPDGPRNAFVVLEADEHLAVHTAEQAPPGVIVLRHRDPEPGERWTDQFRHWKQVLHRGSLCFRLGDDVEAYAPAKALGGYARPWGGPQTWVSQDRRHDPEPWLAVRWDAPVPVSSVELVLDDSLDIDLINLHHHRTEPEVMPDLLTDYRVEAEVDGRWEVLAQVTGNRRRHRTHPLEQPVTATAVRVVAGAGTGSAHVVALRVY
ncbi:FAD-dependent oxidoreductase [Auraticoccus sp. F435]|uniref:FAD-dependent oxidoreductase n=1 Tax=Auraticoccus cholistanensis TaxID=2656650 RepID=A0A6A9URL2_9ACTN|nr:FAD-dependent oxidoreductase [Auraticoccus cholistanensis]MVA74442.1 FAD-dependent oxidoreductase [Auraticoccus cholistanensis]